MKKKEKKQDNRQFDIHTYGSYSGDDLTAYLSKRAEEGWRMENAYNGIPMIEFVKAEPACVHFQWDCLPVNKSKKEKARIQDDMIRTHKEEGWDYMGQVEQALIFASEEEREFSVLHGEWGKMHRVFDVLKKMRRTLILQSVLLAVIMFVMVCGLTVLVEPQEYLEWGLSGAFGLLEGNTWLIFFVTVALFFLMEIVLIFRLPRFLKKEDIFTEKLARGEKVVYDETDYKGRQTGKRPLLTLIPWAIVFLFIVLLVIDYIVQAVSIVFLLNLFMAIGMIFFLGYMGNKHGWSGFKKVLLYLVFCVALIVFDFSMLSLEERLFPQKEETTAENAAYPTSLFQMKTKNLELYHDKYRTILGTMENLDAYYDDFYEGEGRFYYSYYQYETKWNWFGTLLKEQALENLEPFDARKMEGLPIDCEGYRIKWNPETEQYFYTDTFLLISEDEILLIHCNLGPYSEYEILKKFLPETSGNVI